MTIFCAPYGTSTIVDYRWEPLSAVSWHFANRKQTWMPTGVTVARCEPLFDIFKSRDCFGRRKKCRDISSSPRCLGVNQELECGSHEGNSVSLSWYLFRCAEASTICIHNMITPIIVLLFHSFLDAYSKIHGVYISPCNNSHRCEFRRGTNISVIVNLTAGKYFYIKESGPF